MFKNYLKCNEIQQVNEKEYSSDFKAELNITDGEEEINAGANVNTINTGDNIFSEIDITYNKEEFLNVSYLKEGNKHGIKLPGIKQYIVFENNNLKDYIKNLGLEDEEILKFVPNKITGITPDELIELTDSEKEQIKNLLKNSSLL